jgi:hypothetical protein
MCKLRPCSRAWPPKQVQASAFAGCGHACCIGLGSFVPMLLKKSVTNDERAVFDS